MRHAPRQVAMRPGRINLSRVSVWVRNDKATPPRGFEVPRAETPSLVPAPGAQKLGSPHRKPSVKHIAFLLSAYFVNIKSTHLRAPAYVLSSQKIPFKPSPPLKVDLPIGEGFSRGYKVSSKRRGVRTEQNRHRAGGDRTEPVPASNVPERWGFGDGRKYVAPWGRLGHN